MSPQRHLCFRLSSGVAPPRFLYPDRRRASPTDWESRSPEPSFLVILHREGANKVFGKHSTWLLLEVHYHHTSTTSSGARRPSHCLLCAVAQTKRFHLNPIVIKEEESSYVLFSNHPLHTAYVLICICMILLDNLLQWIICIVMIDLPSSYNYNVVLICKSLVMFMSYFWIKKKLKVLLLPRAFDPSS
jgi:hypothetical protein